MRIVLVISLAAAALAESASSSTLNAASPVSAVDGQDVGSVKTGYLRSGVPDEGRTLSFPAVTDNLQSLTNKVGSLVFSIEHRAEKRFVEANIKTIMKPDFFNSQIFRQFREIVQGKTKVRDPNRVMLDLLLPLHEDKVALARRLEADLRMEAWKFNAALQAGGVKVVERYEARDLLNTLMSVMVEESKSINDIFSAKLRLGAIPEDEDAIWDLAILTKFVKLYDLHKPKERETLLKKKLPLLYEGEDVLNQIKLPEEPNPMLDRLGRKLFPMWLAQEKKPDDVEMLLQAKNTESLFSAASKLYQRYEVVYKQLEPNLITKEKL
uniref:RxLR effector candidate protein n=1 Tax=Peronospora matthiolae TaxID=2874970 RepID=A0AAV1TLZ2_9STRA